MRLNMDKNKILEVAYTTIKESTEWGMECEDKQYAYWIDGVVALVDNLIEEIDDKNGKANTD